MRKLSHCMTLTMIVNQETCDPIAETVLPTPITTSHPSLSFSTPIFS